MAKIYLRIVLGLILVLPNSTLAAVSQATLDDLRYYSQYAAQVYCEANTNPAQISSGQDIKCALGNSCPQVQANGAQYLASVDNYGLYSLGANLAYDPVKHKLVLSFRGAKGLGALTQLNASLMSCPAICAGCHCYAGFYTAWTEIRSQVMNMISSAAQIYPSTDLIVTGHSLGAVLSVFATGEIRAAGSIFSSQRVTMYTFGQPRAGDETLSQTITEQGNNFRVTHTDDPAPSIGNVNLGFRHISPEYWINPDNNLVDYKVTTNNIQVLTGTNNCSGNAGTGGYDVPAHVEYFQAQLASCYQNSTRSPGLPYSLGGDQGGVVPGLQCVEIL